MFKSVLTFSHTEKRLDGGDKVNFKVLAKTNNTIVSRNAGDEKNFHPGGRKFIFCNPFFGDILNFSLVSSAFFYFYFFAVYSLFF